MNTLNHLLRKLPKIDSLMRDTEIAAAARAIGREKVTTLVRKQVEQAKQQALADGAAPDTAAIRAAIMDDIAVFESKLVGRVINGTGVMLHTNLGRAPLGQAVFEELGRTLGGYCNLEIDILERRRGVRGPGVSSLISEACGAEDAVVVNNNAASLFLILSALAGGKEVIVSRGELVQIGGGFRIPDILLSAGATLKEVGTTNITTVEDYAAARTENTAMILKVHQANFTMTGFVSAPSLADLRSAGFDEIPIVADLGSGNLVRRIGDLPVLEPTPRDTLRQGADLVCFSADKMLGAGQGGLIAGKGSLIAKLKRHPIMRVVRADKVTFALLQIVLTNHLAGTPERIPLWHMAGKTAETLKNDVVSFIAQHHLDIALFSPVECLSTFGGGAGPGVQIPSFGLAISSFPPDETAAFFQRSRPPIVGTVQNDTFLIDFRTLFPSDLPQLADQCKQLVASMAGR